MSDEKPTVQMPAASNIVLVGERLSALERRFEQGDDKLTRIETKIDALRELLLTESRKREANDEKLGRSLDRIDEKVMVLARDAERQATAISEVHALSMAAVDSSEAALRALQAHGVESATPRAKPAE